jgi:cysteine synthase B
VIAAEPMPGELLQGLRSLEDGFVPEAFDPTVVDAKYLVTTAESIEALRRLTATEGIFAGVSSGGVLAVASRVAESMESGTIVALLADGGWKYLSEEVWSRDLDDESMEALNLW